ncbi:MAG TPA: succinate dehydrogenase assembly factor 2 [Caulobacteraceae bacterium]|jgi:antitoxin CptB|nr:succinate dehydrogenase assembly factor 2 [Caulobacteraceae bacterium]
MDQARLNKLKFRACHRGFREADLILGPFADRRLAGMGFEELDAFERLLEAPDQDLFEWIVGRTPTPDEYDTTVMAEIKAFVAEGRATVPGVSAHVERND